MNSDTKQLMKGMGSNDKERLAIWMIEHGFGTGNKDTLDDLFHELSWQIAELRMELGKKKQLITELADALEEIGHDADEGLIQRAREATNLTSLSRPCPPGEKRQSNE